MEPGWFSDTLISLETGEAVGGDPYCLLEEREEEGTGEKNHPPLLLKLDFLCY